MARDADGFPVPLASGRADSDDGETSCMWKLFSTDNPDVSCLLREQGDANRDEEPRNCSFDLAYELTGWTRYDGGPGRWFWSEPTIRIVRKHILVRCRGGLDV